MFLNAKNLVMEKSLAEAILTSLNTLPGAALMATHQLHLFQNDFTPTAIAVLGDFTEATYTGYAASSGAFSTVANFSPNQSGVSALMVNVATVGTPFVPNTIYGCYITDNPVTKWYMAWRFDQPIPIALAGDFVNLRSEVPLPYNITSEAQF